VVVDPVRNGGESGDIGSSGADWRKLSSTEKAIAVV
jgi:hypothetical protein